MVVIKNDKMYMYIDLLFFNSILLQTICFFIIFAMLTVSSLDCY